MLSHYNFYNTNENVKIRSFPKKLQKKSLKILNNISDKKNIQIIR